MTPKKNWLGAMALALAVALAGYGLYRAGLQRGQNAAAAATQPTTTAASAPGMAAPAPPPAAELTMAQGFEATRRHMATGLKAGDFDPVVGKTILYYHDPMVPGNKFDKPGKSPFMDMMMVPVYAQAEAASNSPDAQGVRISARMQQDLGLRTATVTLGTLSPQVSVVGNIAFNERDQAYVQARATGYIEKLDVRATLDPVRKGQALAELYVPDWIAAQEEFLSLRRMQGPDMASLVDAARQRMRQLGMDAAQIALVEQSGQAQPRMALAAPIGGVVTELQARPGMTVMPGATLFRINGLDTVWANAEVPESQMAQLRVGTAVLARTAAAPDQVLHGSVQAVLPQVNAATRTLVARVELPNPGHLLVPGMLVNMQILPRQTEKSLLIPTEAVIQTGKRAVVVVAQPQGSYRVVEVQTGLESQGQTEIKSGLQAGQQVVVSSQFLIDSEASLQGFETRLNAAAPAMPMAPQGSASAESKP